MLTRVGSVDAPVSKMNIIFFRLGEAYYRQPIVILGSTWQDLHTPLGPTFSGPF